jgi:phosphoglycolate phosphatase
MVPSGNPHSLRAVIFDCDGTLVDSYPAITASVNHVRTAHGLPPLPEGEVRRHVGRGPAYLLEQTVPGGDPKADLALYRAHHPSVLRSGTHLLPGVAVTVAALHRACYRLAVCSNKLRPFTLELLDILGLARFFAVVIGPEDAPRPKPAPDMLRVALERLGIGPKEALYVGDMDVDIRTARAAGVAVWVIPTGSSDAETLKAAAPDHLCHDFAELIGLIPTGRK